MRFFFLLQHLFLQCLLVSFSTADPEPPTTIPPMTPAVYNPDGIANTPSRTTPGPLSNPDIAEIQTRRPEHVAYSPTASPHPDGSSHTTTAHMTTMPMYDGYDGIDTSIQVQSIPVLDVMPLPPLPTTRSQPPQLDIGDQDGGSAGSDRSESSGSGDGDDSSSGAEMGGVVPSMEATLRPSTLLETTTGSELKVTTSTETTSRRSELLEEVVTPGPGLLPAVSVETGPEHPAVVFKEDVTPGTTRLNVDQSLAVPGDDGTSSKPAFHVIVVNVQDKNQSGEEEKKS